MRTIKIKKLHIRKRTLPHWLTIYLCVMPFFLNMFQILGDGFSILKYTLDAAWVGILALTLMNRYVRIRKKVLPMVVLTAVLLAYTAVVYCFRFQSPFYFLWGFRNYFRFYVAFLAFAAFLDERETDGYFRLLEALFWVNVLVSLFQYAVLGYKQDYLGGIFGVSRGCNSNTLVFFSLVLIRSVLQMLNGQKTMGACMLQLVAASVIAAMAELKMFFLILVVIFGMAMLLTKFSWKKMILAVILVLCLFFGSTILVDVFGSSNDLSLENIMRLILSKSYSTANDLGRLSAIPILSRTILAEPLDQLVGLGLGNCDTSAFAICNTPFYQSHGHLNYTWFSTAFLFLETGYIGLTLYALFFAVCLAAAMLRLKRKTGNRLHCQIGVIMAVLCMALMIYNSSLRTDIGYIAYFGLALPFVDRSSEK